MFLKRELTFLAGALVIAFVAKTYFPPPQKGSDFSRKALQTLSHLKASLPFGKSGERPEKTAEKTADNLAEKLDTPSSAIEPRVASAASPPSKTITKAPENDKSVHAPDSLADRGPASDNPLDTSEADAAFADVGKGKDSAEALLALTEKLSSEFRKDAKPSSKAKTKPAAKSVRVVAAYFNDEEERDFLKDEVGLSDQEYRLLQEERQRLKEKLKVAENLKKSNYERANAYKSVLLKNHKTWMQEFLGAERYRLFEDFQEQQDL